MRMFTSTCRNTNELALEILSGKYDRDIYEYLYLLAREKDLKELKNFGEFQNQDPTEYFNFEIELTEPGEILYITPWDMNSCTKRSMDLSEQERKIVLLLAAIIREKFNYVLEIFKPREPDRLDS
jgi:hypothetical protein